MMTYTDFIAVIDLGTSHIVGMAGTRKENNVLSIMGYETEKSEGCIRRGCIYNVEETANKIKRLVRKLENKLNGNQIGKLYMGVSCKSMRTIDHTVSKVLGMDGEVTEAVLRQLDEECRNYQSAMDVLDISSPTYIIDGKEEKEPLGIACSRIDARYKLVVGQPAIRISLQNVAERIKVQLAGIIVSPLALADLILSPEDKKAAIVIDFGAGVTSVSIFRNGRLWNLSIVPLGADLITRDIMSLKVSEMEAERLKRTYGRALPLTRDKKQEKIEIRKLDDFRMQEMSLYDLNEIVEARSREIVENAFARLADAGITKTSDFKIFIAGCGSNLGDLREAVKQRFGTEVYFPLIRKGLIDNAAEMIANNQEYTTATALLLQGKENCAMKPKVVEPKRPTPPTPPVEPEKPKEEETQTTTQQGKVDPNPPTNNGEKKKGSFWGNWGRNLKGKVDDAAKGLFDGDF